MSIADHFVQASDAGFVRDYDPRAAQRQFGMSMVLIVVIAVAATALGALIRFDGPTGSGVQGSSATPPAYAGRLWLPTAVLFLWRGSCLVR